jgi:ATP-dependent RNA helicase DeaD
MFSESTFESLGIHQEILNALNDINYIHPTTVQEKTYKIVKSGKDVLAQSRTGTGKTLAFGIPLMEKIIGESKYPQVLIMTPTRELAIQIKEELDRASKYLKLRNLVVYGGSSISDQIKKLKRGAHIVVGTPGRLKDLVERGALMLHEIAHLVLDEADEMLDMGFYDDLTFILSETPEQKQTLLFSATFPKQIKKITKKYLNDPEIIENDTELRANASIDHYYYETFSRNRLKAVVNIIHLENPSKAILFCQMKSETEIVSNALREQGFKSGFINGDLSQAQRSRVLDEFKNGKLNILVATDVAARGIDIKDVSHVINYSVPQQTETYIHRSGRTARAGREGESIILVTPGEREQFWKLERQSEIKFLKRDVPAPADIAFIKKERFFDQLQNHEIDEAEYEMYKSFAEKLLDDESASSLITKLLGLYSQEVLRINAGYEIENPKPASRNKKRDFIHSKKSSKSGSRGRKDFSGDSEMQKIFINIGRDNQVSAKDILIFMNQTLSFRLKNIGKIDLFNKFSFVQVPAEFAKKVVKELNNKKLLNRKILCEIAKPKK